MGKLKLNILSSEGLKKKKLSINEPRYDPHKLALNYIKIGLQRDKQILNDDIILGRLGIKILPSNTIEEIKRRIEYVLNSLIKELENI